MTPPSGGFFIGNTMEGQDTQQTEQATTSAPAESETSAETEVKTTEVEAKAETEQTPEVDSEGDEQPDKPRKLSRYERMKRRMAAMASELDNYRAQLATGEKQEPKKAAAPKEEDFNGDYIAYQTARAAYEAAQAVKSEFAEREEREQARVHAQRQREAMEDFLERVEDVKPRIADYDDKISAFHNQGGKFSPHVIEEIRDSEKGPELAYYLASNPHIAAELNALTPRDAAREIGRIEARLSLPKPKKQTQAPPPVTPPSGGAAPSKDLNALAKAGDMAAYIKMRNEQDKAKHR